MATLNSNYSRCLLIALSLVFPLIPTGKLIAGDSASTQPASLDDLLKDKMADIRAKVGSGIDSVQLTTTYGYRLVAAAEKYVNDTNPQVRRMAQFLMLKAGAISNKKDERQAVVDKLLPMVDEGPFYADISSALLSSYRTEDFSEAAKEILRNKLTSSKYIKDRIVLLVGLADIKSELPELKGLVDQLQEPLKPLSRKPAHRLAFAALMARARMGVKEDIQRCIEIVESHPNEKEKLQVLFDKITYIRQPEIVDYLKAYFFMDKIDPGPHERLGMPYAQRIGIYLSQMLPDFPWLKPTGKEKDADFDDWVKYNREWLNKQTTWNIER